MIVSSEQCLIELIARDALAIFQKVAPVRNWSASRSWWLKSGGLQIGRMLVRFFWCHRVPHFLRSEHYDHFGIGITFWNDECAPWQWPKWQRVCPVLFDIEWKIWKRITISCICIGRFEERMIEIGHRLIVGWWRSRFVVARWRTGYILIRKFTFFAMTSIVRALVAVVHVFLRRHAVAGNIARKTAATTATIAVIHFAVIVISTAAGAMVWRSSSIRTTFSALILLLDVVVVFRIWFHRIRTIRQWTIVQIVSMVVGRRVHFIWWHIAWIVFTGTARTAVIWITIFSMVFVAVIERTIQTGRNCCRRNGRTTLDARQKQLLVQLLFLLLRLMIFSAPLQIRFASNLLFDRLIGGFPVCRFEFVLKHCLLDFLLFAHAHRFAHMLHIWRFVHDAITSQTQTQAHGRFVRIQNGVVVGSALVRQSQRINADLDLIGIENVGRF